MDTESIGAGGAFPLVTAGGSDQLPDRRPVTWLWDRAQGPATEAEVAPSRTPRERAAGEVVCPECAGIVARVFDGPAGAHVEAWVPAPAPARMRDGARSLPGDAASFGFLLAGPVEGDGSARLTCWKGHSATVSAATCREIVEARRASRRARRVRRTAQA